MFATRLHTLRCRTVKCRRPFRRSLRKGATAYSVQGTAPRHHARPRRAGCVPRVTVRREPVTGVSRSVAPGPTYRLMGLGPAA